MLSSATVTALTAAMTELERDVDARGWGAMPWLFGVFDQPHLGDVRVMQLDELPIDEALWRLHDHALPGVCVPYWVGLRAITRHLAAAPIPPELRYWLHHADRRLIGCGFVCEAFAPPSDPGEDWVLGPDRHAADLRIMTAQDVDGRIYQLLRHRGQDPVITVTPDPAEAMRRRVIPDCLDSLIATFQRPAT